MVKSTQTVDEVIVEPVTLTQALAALDRAAAEVIGLLQVEDGYRSTIHPGHVRLNALETAVADLRTALRLNS